MISFLKKVSIFCSAWIGIYAVIYLTVPRRYYATDSYWLFTTVYNKIDSGNITGNILLGDSKALFGVNAKKLNAINLCLQAETPVEGYYELRQLVKNKTNHIDTVYLSYCHVHMISQDFFYHFAYHNSYFDYKYLDTVRQLAATYHDDNYVLKPSLFSAIDRKLNNPHLAEKKRVLSDFLWGGFNGMFENLKKAMLGQIITVDNQLVNGRMITLPTDTEKFTRHSPTDIMDEQLPDIKPSQVNKIYLDKLLFLAKANNITVAFIQMPALKPVDNAQLQKFTDSLHTIFGNNFIYDTSTYADNLFRDGHSHLNNRGVQKFQSFLQQRAQTIKSKPTNQ